MSTPPQEAPDASEAERRRHIRVRIARSVKLLDSATGRAYAGQTRDIAAGGLCVALDRELNPPQDRPVRVAIDWTSQSPLLCAAAMPTATLLRRLSVTGQPVYALRYDELQALPLAA